MSDSILTTTKKVLSLAEDYDVFDQDIILHINSVFGTLHQLGIGPQDGFEITDATATWDSYLGGNKRLNGVKSYMYLRVRLLFDPPATSFALGALKEQIQEFEWRLNVVAEETGWVEPGIGPAGTILTFDAGIPISRRIRIKDGKMIFWSLLDTFEVRMQIRETSDPCSPLLNDVTSSLTASYDNNDIVVDWVMTGEETRQLHSGYYDMVVSDVGTVDAQAVKILSGHIRMNTLATSAG